MGIRKWRWKTRVQYLLGPRLNESATCPTPKSKSKSGERFAVPYLCQNLNGNAASPSNRCQLRANKLGVDSRNAACLARRHRRRINGLVVRIHVVQRSLQRDADGARRAGEDGLPAHRAPLLPATGIVGKRKLLA